MKKNKLPLIKPLTKALGIVVNDNLALERNSKLLNFAILFSALTSPLTFASSEGISSPFSFQVFTPSTAGRNSW